MAKNNFKILIVDDDDAIRETYVQIFQQIGAEVISAKDGVDGLDLATKQIPDVIITGIIMPRMEGFQMIQSLRENVQTSKIPILILSHLGREEDRKKAEDLGITNFIIQGTMTPKEIIRKVSEVISPVSFFKLSFDPYALDAPQLGKNIGNEHFKCPSCEEKLILEITAKQGGTSFGGVLKCPTCGYAL